MKFLILVVLALVAVTQAKYIMSRNGLSAAMDGNEMDAEPLIHVATLSEVMYIPMARHMSCNNGDCLAACRALGYKHGTCVSDSMCRCYN